MAKALKCDRCGQFYDLLSKPKKYLIEDGEKFKKFVDLCPDCYETFVKWLTGKREHEEVGTGELYPGEFESRHYEFEEESDGSSNS